MQNNDSGAARKQSQRRATPQAAGKILSMALKRFGLEKEVARYEFILHWAEIMGESIAARTRPEGLQNGILTVCVSNPQWAQELVFQKDIILGRLNRFLKDSHVDGIVKDVRFFVGDVRR